LAVQGIFGKINNYLDNRKEMKKIEKNRDELERKEDFRNENKISRQNEREEAINFVKEKSKEIINSNAPLGKKLEAVNEYFKDHNKPKISQAMQDLSDRRYLNLRRRERRFEKMNLVKNLIREEKEKVMNERRERMDRIEETRKMNKCNRDADMLINKARMELKR
jgi:hypothetical protein